MGALFAEGDFIYLNLNNPHLQIAIQQLFQYVEKIKKQIEANTIIFRDFETEHLSNSNLEEEGYAKIKMPNSNVIKNPKWETYDDLLNIIDSKKNRRNIRVEAIKMESLFTVKICENITIDESLKYFQLFSTIKDQNFAFNFFKYPPKIVSILSKYKDWEFIELKLKEGKEVIACAWNFIGNEHYSPMIVGLNYNYLDSHKLYKQIVFQIVKRGNELNKKTIYCGLSADFEKQKYGANSIAKFAFIKMDDTYNTEIISSMANL
jgi:predicted N-acyltransferase